MSEIFYSEDGKYVIGSSIDSSITLDKEEYITVHIFEKDTLKEINSIEFNAGYISSMFTKDNNLYMLFNRNFGTTFNMLVASYNYEDGNLNWSNTYDGVWGKFMTKSYPEGINDLAVVNSNKVTVIDESNGETNKGFAK